MTAVDLAVVRARAERATRGPWFVEAPNGGRGQVYVGNRADERDHGLWDIVHASGDNLSELTREAAATVLADAAHIAGMDPATTLALVARVEAAEAAEAAEARVREVHRERVEPLTGARWCEWCDEHGWPDDDGELLSWPCPTIAALDGTDAS